MIDSAFNKSQSIGNTPVVKGKYILAQEKSVPAYCKFLIK